MKVNLNYFTKNGKVHKFPAARAGEEVPQFYSYGSFEENLSRAVYSARAFLSLNKIKAEKYLEYSLEHGDPNYYWHNTRGIMYPRMPEACHYIAVRLGDLDATSRSGLTRTPAKWWEETPAVDGKRDYQ